MRDETEIEASSAPLIEHLIELRRRLVWSLAGFFIAFLLCFFFAKQLFNLLVVPYQIAVGWAGLADDQVRLIYTAPQEFFFTQVKIAAFGGLFLAFPIIAMQIYKFVAPGLYRDERQAFLPFLVATPILFVMGGAMVYFFFMPMVMWFFLSMQQIGVGDQPAIELLPRVSEYLSLVMTLIFAFGLVFQLPVVTSLLARAGIVSAEGLKGKRKYAIVLAFVAAAVLTPPDPMSQIGLAVPTILLYEISILTARLIERKRAERQQESEASAE
ncbi:twin-arginine translocase subunit TatC [Consotaella aegiceratis]|uniref:twin-arginine translocase subunit TatC n=1 Tax=Consotaella aegiceratis TaxID=3097961 RepID=UPI002F41F47F